MCADSRKNDFERDLQIPSEYQCVQKTVSSGEEALLILLRRLAYPSRWCDLVPLFGRSVSELCLIFQKVRNPILYIKPVSFEPQIIDDIYRRFRHLSEDLCLAWLDAPALILL